MYLEARGTSPAPNRSGVRLLLRVGPCLHVCPPSELYTPLPWRDGEFCALGVIPEGCLAKGLSWWEVIFWVAG